MLKWSLQIDIRHMTLPFCMTFCIPQKPIIGTSYLNFSKCLLSFMFLLHRASHAVSCLCRLMFWYFNAPVYSLGCSSQLTAGLVCCSAAHTAAHSCSSMSDETWSNWTLEYLLVEQFHKFYLFTVYNLTDFSIMGEPFKKRFINLLKERTISKFINIKNIFKDTQVLKFPYEDV